MIGLIFAVVLNLFICTINLVSIGRAWPELKAVGGFTLFTARCAYWQSVLGYTVFIFAGWVIGLNAAGWLAPSQINGACALAYLVLVPGLLFTGTVIWLQSVAQAFRSGSWIDGGVAAWNTYATVHNTLSAIDTFPKAFEQVGSLFGTMASLGGDSDSSSDSDNPAAGLIAIVVVAALGISLVGGWAMSHVVFSLAAGSAPRAEMPSELQYAHEKA